MKHKPGFYFYELFGNLGTVIALVYPDGKLEKIYIGNDDLLNKFVMSDEWYPGEVNNLDTYEYIGL
jgi:hypothetical protein